LPEPDFPVQPKILQKFGSWRQKIRNNLIHIFRFMDSKYKHQLHVVRREAIKNLILVVLVATLLLSGCANMSATEQRVLSGGAIGAASGAVIGAAAGSAALGAAAGAGAGLVGGYVYDQYQKSKGNP
jgi:osmotically inducible lipoprotein OsmB